MTIISDRISNSKNIGFVALGVDVNSCVYVCVYCGRLCSTRNMGSSGIKHLPCCQCTYGDTQDFCIFCLCRFEHENK